MANVEPHKPLSKRLKKRIAAFHASIPPNTYWWHDPRYLELCAEIKKERTGA